MSESAQPGSGASLGAGPAPPVPPAYTPGAARTPPRTGTLDLLRLAGALVGDALRQRRAFSPRLTLRAWAARAAARRGSSDVVLDLKLKRLLLVGTPELSAGILAAPPSEDAFVAGKLKRDAMAFLAPNALTIAEGDDWRRLRALNERVLEPGRPHDHAATFVGRVRDAFRPPVATPDDVREAMQRAMLAIVFGPGVAPASLADDVATLAGYVQQPVKRALLAPLGRRRRERFYRELRRACDAAAASSGPSLVGLARRGDDHVGTTELLEQVPHWMFTFPGSGTDLLVRTLALVCAHPDARSRALAELAEVGLPVDDAAAVGRLTWLRACLREAADLYPPVTRTLHRAPNGAVVAGVAVPAGMDVLHAFPPFARDLVPAPPRFRPERWLADPPPRAAFDPFLGGARACPGRDLITFVCTAALAVLLGEQRLALDGAPLAPDALPTEFPRRGIRFRPA